MPEIDIGYLILWFVVFLFSLTIHESAHAWTSEKFGDPTGRYLGRITLNPIPHIDPFGTILFPLVGQLFGGVMFGWAKPVPVNPHLWSQKRKASILTSAAGPASNLLLAVVGLVLAKALMAGDILQLNFYPMKLSELLIPVAGQGVIWQPIAALVCIMIFLNISLGIFNLIPVPPLDGSHILQALLPYEMASAYEQLRPFGFILLFGLIMFGAFGAVIRPFMRLALIILAPEVR